MEQKSPDRLPRRDIILLPLISLGTVILLFAIGQAFALRFYAIKDNDGCYKKGTHRPNCVTYMKIFEGPWVQYRFNNCGYRSLAPCGPKPPGTLRIAIIGTSMAEGLNVQYDDSYATLLGKRLSALLGRPVEIQNLAMMGLIRPVDELVPKALALDPDLILMVATPTDPKLLQQLEETPAEPSESTPASAPAPKHESAKQRLVNAVHDVTGFARQMRIMAVVQHYLMDNEQIMYDLYRRYRDPDDPLQAQFSPLCLRRLTLLDAELGRISAKIGNSGVPFVMMLVPNRMQAAMASNGVSVPGTDPYHLSREVAAMAAAHGLKYIDILPEFQTVPHAEKLFYPVDGHANAAGHKIIAEGLVKRLMDGSVPAFARNTRASAVQ
jgi:hypothetical protein